VVQTYTTEQIVGWGGDPQNLQAFVGNREIGFKTALNHRMLAIFAAIFFGGLWWAFAPRRPRVDLVGLLLATLPLLIDGFSHVISEQSEAGFRATNEWAALLTGHIFSDTFYSDTAFGTLNWLLRTITGLIFGLGLVWFLYPFLAHRFKVVRAQLEPKLRRIGAI
ncbi:MAG: DUF2085 domain-containing protein, partial [Anaerolineae bacterium]|nr:DUF2085 domain-containing protein [Anaerolineae bacterium]